MIITLRMTCAWTDRTKYVGGRIDEGGFAHFKSAVLYDDDKGFRIEPDTDGDAAIRIPQQFDKNGKGMFVKGQVYELDMFLDAKPDLHDVVMQMGFMNRKS